MQLVELQNEWPTLQQHGVALFAVSYDSVDTLASFAERRGITYPLLSDEGSHTIRALGLLNEHLAEQHAFYGVGIREDQQGVAYPGTFVLDEQGIVVAKHFEQSYRVRPTAQQVGEYALEPSADRPPRASHLSANGVDVWAWTDSPTYRPYQQLRLNVEIALAQSLHVYGRPTPAEYTPLELRVEPQEGLTVGACVMPTPVPFHLEGLDEELFVYRDTVRLSVPLYFLRNQGATVLGVEVSYQTCTDTTCFPPTADRLEVSLEGLDLIRD